MPATLTSSAAAQDSGAVSAAQAQDSTGALPGQVQKTKYDIEAVKNAAPGITPTASTAPALNPQSLGSLTRSKSRSEVARGLSSSGKEEGYKWRPPVDYFGASASAFSSSFSGSSNRDLNALKKPSDAQNNNAASATPPQPTAPHPAMPPNPTPFANAPGTGPTTIKPLPFSAPNSSPFGNAPLPAPAPLPLPVPPVPPVPSVPVVPPVPPVPAVPPVSPPFPSGAATPAVPPAPTVPPQPLPNQPGPATPLKVYESTTDATALSPKMAKFIESLREREITGSGSAPTMPQAATSVDLNAVPQQQAATSVDMNAAPQAPAAPVQPATAPSVLKPSSEAKPSSTPATADQTSRDLAPLAKENDAEAPPSKSTGDTPLAPKSSSQVAELRESIISQKSDGQSDDWHPIGEKKSPRKVDPQFSAELDDFKTETIRHKSDSERHLTLEEMAAMDPDLLLAPQTPQQQSIRRLKNAGGIHAEIYIPIYLICIGLSWVTEQSAVSGTFRDAGQRVESSLQLIAPKTLAENFRAGVDAFDDRDIKLHPFNPNKPRSIVSLLISRIQAFCSGLSSAFSRIPGTIASSTANNPLAQVMVLLSYLSVFSLALMIYFRFKRSTSWIIADFILLPIGLVAASTVITAVLISVLSMSVSLGAGIVSNTIVLYTTLAVVLCVSDMARRTFFRRKNQ
ncbi:MAG: hypothetical protein EKK48_13725 [Candidatus Melainabacteria bacterium]|nr:MAG: hypothetical protein EKK48_13725 [Candidatus Melainabacteria bacterium]